VQLVYKPPVQFARPEESQITFPVCSRGIPCRRLMVCVVLIETHGVSEMTVAQIYESFVEPPKTEVPAMPQGADFPLDQPNVFPREGRCRVVIENIAPQIDGGDIQPNGLEANESWSRPTYLRTATSCFPQW